jgi:hypothetical protein
MIRLITAPDYDRAPKRDCDEKSFPPERRHQRSGLPESVRNHSSRLPPRLGHADRDVALRVSRKGRSCGPTAQELQPGMLVLLDRAFERQRVLRRDQPRRGRRCWPGPVLPQPAGRCPSAGRFPTVRRGRTRRPDHRGRRDRDGRLPALESDISRCTDGTTLGPDLIFSKINVPSELVVRAASRRRPSASGIEHHRLNAATLVVLPAQLPFLSSG